MQAYATAAISPERREELVLEHLPQVNWIALRIHEQLHSSVQLDDLVSAGILGLLAAIDKFDPSFEASLKTYAEYKIRGAILDSIRGMDGIPTHKRKRTKEVQQAISRAEQKLQRTASEDEIASELNISVAEYQDWMVELQGVSLGSLDVIEAGEEVNLLKFLPDPWSESPERILARSELERLVTEGVQKMPENERTVLSLYYKEELTLREIASVMDLHITRISQLRAQGVLRLRSYMEYKWPSKKGLY